MKPNVSNDQPADIIGLYLNAPQNAAVFCVDDKAVIRDSQAQIQPHSEHHPGGALSLLTTFESGVGNDYDDASSTPSAEFVAFLTDIVASQPYGKEIHVIADNLAAHKTVRVNEFLLAYKTVHLHFTPSYSSWLSHMELWLSKIERDVCVGGALSARLEVTQQLLRHIRDYSGAAKILKWKYFNPVRGIAIDADGRIH